MSPIQETPQEFFTPFEPSDDDEWPTPTSSARSSRKSRKSRSR